MTMAGMNTVVFLVMGGGIAGICIALEVKQRHPDVRVALREDVKFRDCRHWGKPAICAELLHFKARKLEIDFVRPGDRKLFRVLDAVTSAWICSLQFAKYVYDKVEGFLK